MIKARSSTSVDLPVGGVWVIDVRADDTVVVTVTLPAGGTAEPTVEDRGNGCYRAEYTVGPTGRYIARAVGTSGAVDFTAYVTATVTGTAMPDITDLDDHLKEHSYDDDDLQDALDAEAAAQRRVCNVPAAYSADLRRALLRRAQRALAMKKLKLGVVEPTADSDAVRIGWDSEIRRYEAPYRRLPVG